MTIWYQHKTDFIESLAEELRLNGFDVKISVWAIHLNSPLGTFIFNPSYHEKYMKEVWNFIRLYGRFIEQYGEEQLKEYEKKQPIKKVSWYRNIGGAEIDLRPMLL
jgi:hypothetical protein